MFESEELKRAIISAREKNYLYYNMRSMYTELSHAYVRIRMDIDKITAKISGRSLIKKFGKRTEHPRWCYKGYPIPMLLEDGNILTVETRFLDGVIRFNINNRLYYAINSRDKRYEKSNKLFFFDHETLQNQQKVEDKLSDYSNTIWKLQRKLKETSFTNFSEQKKFRNEINEQKKLYKEFKLSGKSFFEGGISRNQVIDRFFEEYQVSRRDYKQFSKGKYKMKIDIFPFKRQKQLSESEEIKYLQDYVQKIDVEINKIRNYIPTEDDAYITYLAHVNDITVDEVMNNFSSDIYIYRWWLFESVRIYFRKQLSLEENHYEYVKESKKNRARFIQNIISDSHVSKNDYVYGGYDAHFTAKMLEDKYNKINSSVDKKKTTKVNYLKELYAQFQMSDHLQ